MKIKIMFKDPDGVQNALDEAAKESLPANITEEDEREALYEKRREKVADKAAEWIDCGEYCAIEIDTEAKTARVLKVSEHKGW